MLRTIIHVIDVKFCSDINSRVVSKCPDGDDITVHWDTSDVDDVQGTLSNKLFSHLNASGKHVMLCFIFNCIFIPLICQGGCPSKRSEVECVFVF